MIKSSIRIAIVASMAITLELYGYSTSIESLSQDEIELYNDAYQGINRWDGDYQKLEKAGFYISQFLKNNQSFLPIYIEKCRYIIIKGGLRKNNWREGNEKALAILDEIKEWDSKYAKAYVLAGHVLTNLGDLEGALLNLEIAKELGTNDPWYFINYAEVKKLQGQYKTAFDYSILGLQQSKDNMKAASSAVLNIAWLTSKLESLGTPNNLNVTQIILDSIGSHEDRLAIANYLRANWNGRTNFLDYALKIIMNQKVLNPSCHMCDIYVSSVILELGYLHHSNSIPIYTDEAKSAVLEILKPLTNDDEIKNDLYPLLFKIAFSNRDMKEMNRLMKKSFEMNVDKEILYFQEARMRFMVQDYTGVIKAFNNLIEIDPEYANYPLLHTVYDILGDSSYREKQLLSKIEHNPFNAWAYGNYAEFLLCKKDDHLNAIKFAKKAKDLMDYPSNNQVLGMAYKIAAAKMAKSGSLNTAIKHYKTSLDFEVSKYYLSTHCHQYCSEIFQLESLF